MKKLIFTLAILGFCGNAHAFPNMKKYQHEVLNLQSGVKTYTQVGYDKFYVTKTKDDTYLRAFNADLERSILIELYNDNIICTIYKKGELTDTSNYYVSVTSEIGDVVSFFFDKGKYIYYVESAKGCFQTFDNDSNRYDI